MRRWPRLRLWPRTLTAQLVSLLLLALVVSQVTTFAILNDERRDTIEALAREQVLERAAALVRLADATATEAERRRALRAMSTRSLRFWLAAEPIVDRDQPIAGSHLGHQLEQLLDDGRELEVRVASGNIARRPPDHHARWREQWRRAELGEPPAAIPRAGLLLAIGLDPGLWLNAAMVLPPERPAFGPAALAALLAAALAVSLVAGVSLRRLTRPLGALAAAAEAVGRGEPTSLEAERGPLEIRRTAAAFNTMQERIGRSMRDRTRLLAAISHDLRTPITTLRLRAEMVEDEELKARMLATLDEMQALTEAGLLLARDTASEEPTRPVDLNALIESIAADFIDQGAELVVVPAAPVTLRCRKLALTRAIRNLVENAVRYGGRTVIRLAADAAAVRIIVEDSGPGLPEAMLERVFEPFFRLEESRSRETGGAGLGLAIARAIARAHGGDIRLANRPEGGLTATLQLPPPAALAAAAPPAPRA